MRLFITLIICLFTTHLFARGEKLLKVDYSTSEYIHIKEVETYSRYTEVIFVAMKKDRGGQYIFLNPPGHPDAMYIVADEKKYKLISTQDIGSEDGQTAAYPGEPFYFSARFERIPSSVNMIDIKEGENGSWHFYGVHLNRTFYDKSFYEEIEAEREQFRRDFHYVAMYDEDIEPVSGPGEGYNTFIMNANDNGDVKHITAGGSEYIYRKLSKVSEDYTDDGDHYQAMTALDKDGDKFEFLIFDDLEIGIMMIYGNLILHFFNK